MKGQRYKFKRNSDHKSVVRFPDPYNRFIVVALNHFFAGKSNKFDFACVIIKTKTASGIRITST